MRLIVAVCWFLLLSVGCGPVENIEGTEGTFEASVLEPINVTMGGRAVFGNFVDPASKRAGVLIQLFSGSERGASFTGRVDGTPAPGTYEIVEYRNSSVFEQLRPNEFFGLYVHGGGTEFSPNFNSQAGSLTVTETPNEFIFGEFSFTAAGYQTKENGTLDSLKVNVTGSFRAKKGTVELQSIGSNADLSIPVGRNQADFPSASRNPR